MPASIGLRAICAALGNELARPLIKIEGPERPVLGAAMISQPTPDVASGRIAVAPANMIVTASLIERLDGTGSAGVWLVGDVGDRIGPGARERAVRCAFPVFAAPTVTSADTLICRIYDILLEAERASSDQAQARASIANAERFASVTLEELISGHREGADEIEERAASLGWDLERPRAVLLASIDPPMTATSNPTALPTMAAAARESLGEHAIVWTRSNAVAALLAPDSDSPIERRAIADRLRAILDQRVRSVTISVGVGRRVDHPRHLSRSFTEARRAVEVGRWVKGRHVTELFDELGLERLLSSTPQEELELFVAETIGPLAEHDRTRGGDLIATLSIWLETRNIAAAARRLDVHYNTLKNRLDRIEMVLGPILSTPSQMVECEVALHIARHHGIQAESASS